MNGLTQARRDEYNLDADTLEKVLELTGGENPFEFLAMDESDTALGLIRGINDEDRVKGWRKAEKEFFSPSRDLILDALDERESELKGKCADDSVGESEGLPESSRTQPINTGSDESTTRDTDPEKREPHPESKLGLEEVLVIDRDGRTEFVTANPDTETDPYHSRTVDDETGDVWNEQTLSKEDILSRLALEPERTTTDEIDSTPTGVAA